MNIHQLMDLIVTTGTPLKHARTYKIFMIER